MKATFKNFEVSSKLNNEGVQFPNEKNGSYTHNEFLVTVKNTETKNKIGFKFYGSTSDFQAGKVEMDESDLLNAFYCLLSDGLAAKESFGDFCSEFGYDEDSRTAYRIYKGCKKQLEKAEKLIGDADYYDLINELQEVAG